MELLGLVVAVGGSSLPNMFGFSISQKFNNGQIYAERSINLRQLKATGHNPANYFSEVDFNKSQQLHGRQQLQPY